MFWPIPPKTPKLAHFDQPNDIEEEACQHKMVVKKSKSRKKSPNFILSMGFPLRYLARMEPSHEKLIIFLFRHECSNEFEAQGELTIQQGQDQLIYLPLGN